jgi:hypothetical protein
VHCRIAPQCSGIKAVPLRSAASGAPRTGLSLRPARSPGRAVPLISKVRSSRSGYVHGRRLPSDCPARGHCVNGSRRIVAFDRWFRMFTGRMPGMRGKLRELLPMMVIAAAIAGAAGWWGYSVWRSPHRNDLATYGQYAIALTVFGVSVIAGARRWFAKIRRESGLATTAGLNELTNHLAEVVKDEWTRAANDRGLLVPEPIRVRWRRPSAAIAGPPSAAAGTSLFQPLPGMNPVTAEQLKEGEIRDLHELYGGLGSGRLVIAGAPGAGKSGAAVLLILTALRHREQVDEADRPNVPVPVMFTLHGWNPDAQPVQDWLAVRLGQTYPQLAGRDGAIRATLLLATGKIAVILDGLDEISEELRPIALRALSQQAAFRLVILTRMDEMAAAAAKGPLEGAAAVELQDIDATTAADYLTRVQLDPPPPGWSELTDRLRRPPSAPIAKALSTPLALTLVRDTYREGDNVRDLLDFCCPDGSPASRDDIMDHLLDRVLPAAYTKRPGHRRREYNLQTAQNALRCIAAQMHDDATYDLRWWQIPRWASPRPRVLATGFVAGLAIGLATALAPGGGPGTAVSSGLITGVGVGGGAALLSTRRERIPRQIQLARWSEMIRSEGFAARLGAGLAAALPAGFFSWYAFGLVTGLGVALVVALFAVLIAASGRSSIDRTSSFTPLAAWRNDRRYWLAFGLVVGLALGVAFGMGGGHNDGVMTGVTAAITGGVAIGLAVGLMAPATWSASLAFVQLARLWHTPPRMMRLLEDAHQRGVLRTVGPVYQFRHARLQDRLAERSSAADRESAGDRRAISVQLPGC